MTVVDDIESSEMAGDEWIVDDGVLESAQFMIEQHDVFFECETSRCRHPTLLALDAAVGEWEPFV